MAIVVGKRLFGGGCFDERREFQLSLERSVTPLGVVSIHLVSFLWEGGSLASQCLLFCLEKSYIKSGGINSNTYARSQPMLPKLAPFQSV